MEHNILLSICIPTYNRVDYLKQNLDILLPQLYGYFGEIEILISDNCSSDNTQEVIREAVKKSKYPVIYNRNDKNIGGVDNIALVISKSKGRYIYVMGDDDIPSPNLIQILMPILKSSEELSIIHWNRLSGDEKCCNNQVVDGEFADPTEKMSVPNFIKKILNKASLISSLVFNRQCWYLGTSFYKEEYLGYNWYGRILYGALIYSKNCLYYYFPLLIQRNPPKSWINYWPQYHISCMSSVFLDLDSHIPGLYDIWSMYLRRNVKNVLPGIMIDKKYYRRADIKKSLSKHLTQNEIIRMNCYLYFPFSYTIYRGKNYILRKIIKVLSRWK